ncbi:triosephosphate isomerase [Paecilomyces variotii No. 5]|uniref:Triosephosphate isomerase n=1 Tax=Byssochlamys spectabilis (strain No. 5 / NBRC 109023) TaxID=1356009 RepID=V5FMR1_BYSSN|nr:triosephosphate isomerase [Paecilomyces variotii No. 5]
MPRKFFVGGNFKMYHPFVSASATKQKTNESVFNVIRNGSTESIKGIIDNLNSAKLDSNTEVVIAPPFLYLHYARDLASPNIAVSAQNVYDKPNGAFTGEVSVDQLKDAKVTWTLVGHSERRTLLKETDEFVASKTKAAIEAGLGVILCIGESLEEREANKTIDVVTRQLTAVANVISKEQWSQVVIAYEPIWAIGTGKVATTEQAQEVHAAIRKFLAEKISPEVAENTRIIYGGSVSEKNCRELAKQPDVDGFLVGGASLKPAFVDIINARL